MDTKTARRKIFDVEYVVVSEENINEVASWCNGAVGGEGSDRYVKIIDKNALNTRQTKGYIGDYIVRYGRSFKSFGQKAFKKGFDELGETVEHARSAKSGQFVSKDEAAANPDTTVVETTRTPHPEISPEGIDVDAWNKAEQNLADAPDGVDPKTLGSDETIIAPDPEVATEDLRGL